MMPILLGAIAVGGFILMSKSGGSESAPARNFVELQSDSGLPDINPDSQGGNWTTVYDWAFSKASEVTGVPFALLKAHAIRESNLKVTAIRQEPAGNSRPPSASYGLMQILWWPGSARFEDWGYSDDTIGDGSILYQADVNCIIAGRIIDDNYSRLKNLRDAINAYNTGVRESVRVAPGNYVDDVLKNYETLIGRKVLV